MRRLDGIYAFVRNPEVQVKTRRFGVLAILISMLVGLAFSSGLPSVTKGETGAASNARLWSSGAELNSTTADMEVTGTSGTMSISSSTKRSGDYAYRANPTSSTGTFYKTWAASAQTNKFWFRTYLRIADDPSADTYVMQIGNGASGKISVRLTTTSTLQLRNEEDNANIGSASSALSASTWYRVEVFVDTTTISSTDAELRLDGVSIASSTAENLAAGVDRLTWGSSASGTTDLYFDDIAINDSTGRADNWPSEGKIVHMNPNADGDNVAWAASAGSDFETVDEVTPDTADYISSQTNGHIDDFDLESASSAGMTNGDTVKLVSVGLRLRPCGTTTAFPCTAGEDNPTYNARIKASSGGTTEDGATVTMTNSTTYYTNDDDTTNLNKLTIYDLPGTSTAKWTTADLDTTQIGVRNTDTTGVGFRVATIWLQVEYIPATGGRIWSSGYELNSTTANVEWSSVTGSPTVQSSVARSGTYALQSATGGARSFLQYNFATTNADGAFFVRAYLRIGTANSGEFSVIELRDTSDVRRAYITLTATNTLKLFDEDGQVGSASSALSTDTWYRVEMKFDRITGSADGVVEAKIDGASAFAASTTRSISTGVGRLAIGNNIANGLATAGQLQFDDIAINTDIGTTQNDYPGTGSIIHLKPNGNDATNTAWTNDYTNVDEITPNDATDFISETITGNIEDYDIENATFGDTATVNVVSVGARFNTSSATQEDFRVRLKAGTSGTAIESPILAQASTTWVTNQTAAPNNYPVTAYSQPEVTTTWNDTALDSAQIGVRDVSGSGTIQVSTLWLLVEYVPATITISGTCDQYDRTTDCSDDGSNSIKVAVNGNLQGQSDTTVDGAWSIASVVQPAASDIVTVFIDANADTNEAVAVTKYDGTGNISGIVLYQRHLTLGSDDNPTLSNVDIDAYDNSVSGDEDIFFEIDANDDLTVDSVSTYTDEYLFIKTGTTYRPGSGGSSNINTTHLENDGTLQADANAININGSWQNDGTFTADTSTTTFTSTTTGRTLAGTMTGTSEFYNLTFNGVSGGWTFSAAVETGNSFQVVNGAVAGNGQNLTVANDFTLDNTTGVSYVAGAGTITIGDDMINAGAKATWSTGSTVRMTGTSDGTSTFTSVTSANTFYNLEMGFTGTTTATGSSTIKTSNLMTIKGGTVSSTSSWADVRASTTITPLVIESGSSFTGSKTMYFVGLSSSITITLPTANANLGTWSFAAYPAANNITYKLGANITTTGNFLPQAETGVTGSVFDTDNNGNFTITAGYMIIAPCTPSRTGAWTVYMRGGSHSFSDTGTGITTGSNCGAHTIDMGSSIVSVKGPVTLENGTGTLSITPGTGTLMWTHTSGSKTYTPSGETFYNITLDCSGGTVAPNAAVIVSNDLTMTAGILSSSSNVTVNGSTVGVAGTFSYSGSAVHEQRVAANETFGTTSGATNWSFVNLRFTNSTAGSLNVTTESGGSGSVTVTSVMTVGLATDLARTILLAGARTWNLTGTGGDPLLVDDATTGSRITGSTSTFTFSGANAGGNTNVENNASGTYYNLNIGGVPLCTNDTYDLEGAIDIDNDLTINSCGTLDTVSGQNYGITIGGSYANSGAFTARSGTVTFDAGSGSKTLSGTMTGASAFYNIVFNNASGGWSFGSTSALVTNNFTITAGTVTGSSGTITINGNYANSGTFTHNSGTVTLAGTAQALSGTMTGSSAFHNLISNQSIVLSDTDCERTGFVASVDFNAAATVSNLFTISGNADVEFNSGSTYTINDMNWGASGNIQFRNSADTGTWLLVVTAAGNQQDRVSNVDVSRSDASGGATIIASDGTNTNCNNNTNWQFDETLTLSFDSTSKNFGVINGGDTPADQTTTLTATSNSSTGYTIYGWTTTKLRMTRDSVDYDIDDWTGTNATPTTWSGGSYGFGYNTDDITLTGGTADRFTGSKYASFVHAGYGDPVADRTAAATSATNTISYRFYPAPTQTAGTYSTTVIYVITANFP